MLRFERKRFELERKNGRKRLKEKRDIEKKKRIFTCLIWINIDNNTRLYIYISMFRERKR